MANAGRTALLPCIPHDVAADVHDGEPDVTTLRQAVLMPKVDGPLDPAAGIYDRTGRRCSAADLLHHHPTIAKAPFRPFLNQIDVDIRCHRPAIFGGSLERHYGHFITECLGTLWYAAARARPDDVVVVSSTMSSDEIHAVPWISAVLEAAGLRREQLLSARVPIRFDHLIVPGSAFCEDAYVFRLFAAFCQRLGARLSEPTVRRRLVYSSRRAVAAGSMRLENELLLEERLRAASVDIVRPEDLTIGQQVGLFQGGNVLLGAIGSAFHTSIFSAHPACVVFTPQASIARSFALMDASHPVDIDYRRIVGTSPSHQRAAGVNVDYRADDPDGVAAELLELGRAKLAARADAAVDAGAAPARSLDDLVPVAVTTAAGEQLGVRVEDRLLVANTPEAPVAHGAVRAFRDGRILFLAAADDELGMIGDGRRAFWSFTIREQADGIVVLRSLQTGLLLSVPPARERAPAHLRCVVANEWERFRLVPSMASAAEQPGVDVLLRRLDEHRRRDPIHAMLGWHRP